MPIWGLLVGMILVVYQIDVLFGHKRGLVGTKGLDEIAVLGDFVRGGGVCATSGHKGFEREVFAQLIGGFAWSLKSITSRSKVLLAYSLRILKGAQLLR